MDEVFGDVVDNLLGIGDSLGFNVMSQLLPLGLGEFAFVVLVVVSKPVRKQAAF